MENAGLISLIFRTHVELSGSLLVKLQDYKKHERRAPPT
jgi:hypothetical protein